MQHMNRLASLLGRVYAHALRLGNSEDGQGMVEYSFIIILVVVVVIVTVLILGHQTLNMWSDIQGTMKNAMQ
jgi:Flp pilus assembly pilin Flp